MKYNRVLLKLSGESLADPGSYGIQKKRLEQYVNEIVSVKSLGLELAIVIGGGNIFRGREGEYLGIDRAQADHMGMVATLLNAMAIQSSLENQGLHTRMMSSLKIDQVCEPYIRRRAIRHIEKGRVVIFGAGLGKPYFTTDSAASHRAVEIQADAVLKGTSVAGVYSEDPQKNPEAEYYPTLSFNEAYTKRLQVMDLTAFTLCEENKLPIVVFNIHKKGNLLSLIQGEAIGTLIS